MFNNCLCLAYLLFSVAAVFQYLKYSFTIDDIRSIEFCLCCVITTDGDRNRCRRSVARRTWADVERLRKDRSSHRLQSWGSRRRRRRVFVVRHRSLFDQQEHDRDRSRWSYGSVSPSATARAQEGESWLGTRINNNCRWLPEYLLDLSVPSSVSFKCLRLHGSVEGLF